MGGLFGKSRKVQSRVTEQDRAVLQMKQQRDKIKQYQKRIELTLEKDRNLARVLLRENKKDRARLLLRKKKFQEQILQKTDGQLENLERLVHDLEFAQVEMQVLDGLKLGNAALKKVHDVLNIDEIEKILEESREGIEKQREIDEVLSGALSQEDEDDVLAELEDIIQTSLPEVPLAPISEKPSSLPEVPTQDPQPSARERRRLQKVAIEAE